MNFAFIVATILILSQGLALAFGEECQFCWDSCWKPTDSRLTTSYRSIHQMVSGLHSMRVSYGADATAFIFDATENNNNVYAYQRLLAAITSLTLPVGNECKNPLYFATYYHKLSVTTDVNFCQDKCTFSEYLAHDPNGHFPNVAQSSWYQTPFTACQAIKSIMQFQNWPCQYVPENPMLVSFTNGPKGQFDAVWWPFDSNACAGFGFPKAVVQVGDAVTTVPSNPAPWGLPVEPSPWAKFHLKFYWSRYNAAKAIYKCIKERCCNNNAGIFNGPKELYYLGPGMDEVGKMRFSRDALKGILEKDAQMERETGSEIPEVKETGRS